jgi:hypothetical protein
MRRKGGDPGRTSGQPDPKLGLAFRGRRHDLVGGVDQDQGEERTEHQCAAS